MFSHYIVDLITVSCFFLLYVEYYLNLPEISQIIAEILLLLQEVTRIKNEHPDDNHCIVNDRVKGRLKVTRAFGAGSLKQVCSILLSFPHFFYMHNQLYSCAQVTVVSLTILHLFH